ncbi:MAG: roadblock/LC7 domain-containing protein [Candidatus Hodarchaeota archaeon]
MPKSASMPKEQERLNQLQGVLDELVGNPHILGSVIVGETGFPVSVSFDNNIDQDNISALSAGMLSLGEQAVEYTNQGQLRQVIIEGTGGVTVLKRATKDLLIMAVIPSYNHLGSALLNLRKASNRIGEIERMKTTR